MAGMWSRLTNSRSNVLPGPSKTKPQEFENTEKSSIGNIVNLEPDHKEDKTAPLYLLSLKAHPAILHAFVRIAGLSGALAVCLGAYGFHVFRHKEGVTDELKLEFEIANKFHFFHSLALLAVPLVRKPIWTGILMLLGIFLFCGSSYYHCITGNEEIIQLTPYGGQVLIFAWISMAF